MKKHFISAVLLAALTASSLAACASGGEASETTAAPSATTAETTTEAVTTVDPATISDLPDKYDLGGFELRVIKQQSDKIAWSLNLFAPAEQNGETLNDAAFSRNQRVTEKYNFKITESTETSDPTSKLRQAVLAGDTPYDAALCALNTAAKYSFEGTLHDFNSIPNINLEKDYWDQNIIRDLSVNGKIFFMNGQVLVSDDDSLMMIMYNRELADELGIDNLYKVHENGGWTYDKLEACAKKAVADLDGNGVYDVKDRIGFLYVNNNSAPPNFAAANVYIFDSTGKGEPKFVLDNDRAYSLYEKVNRIIKAPGYSFDWSKITENPAATIASLIENKQVLFQQMVLSFVRRNYRDITLDFGLLTQPKLDEKQDDYYSCVGLSTPYLFFPANLKDKEKTGFAFEALAADSYELTDAYYSVCMESKYTRDAESYEMIKRSMKNLVYDVGFTYDWGGLGTKLKSDIMTGDGNLASLIASYKEPVVASMQKAYADMK